MAKKPFRPYSVTDNYEVELHWVEPGVVEFVRLLSDEYAGIMTHYVPGRTKRQGRTRYCVLVDQGRCELCGKFDRIWKGYTPVQVYDQSGDAWVPAVLEMTERVEAIMRRTFARGQVWELSRPKKTQPDDITAVTAVFSRLINPVLLPMRFPVIPAMKRHYHCEMGALDIPNPMPEPMFAEISKNEGGDDKEQNSGAKKRTEGTAAWFKDRGSLREALEKTEPPSPSKNGEAASPNVEIGDAA
jgi:hypothetical protein